MGKGTGASARGVTSGAATSCDSARKWDDFGLMRCEGDGKSAKEKAHNASEL